MTACAAGSRQTVSDYFPKVEQIEDEMPTKVRAFLTEALESLHGPTAAIILVAASAVDEMLKIKDLKGGSLYARIDKAETDHVITSDMAKWAHQIRLDANDQRHADEAANLPAPVVAKRCVEFARSLGMFLFVLPARVTRGIEDSKPFRHPKQAHRGTMQGEKSTRQLAFITSPSSHRVAVCAAWSCALPGSRIRYPKRVNQMGASRRFHASSPL